MYDTKNTPKMEKPQSFVVLDEVVYNADEIYKYDKLFFIGCSRSRLIVEKKNLPESMYFYAYQKDGEWIKSNARYCRAKLFLKADYVLQNVPKMMDITETSEEATIKPQKYKYEEAPEILELEEHEKFKDENGEPIEIEVRGERNSRNCYFRVKDVSDGFDMPSLRKTLLTDDYIKDIDYKTFTTSSVINNDTCRPKIFMFLTYEGMVKLLYVSRNKKAKAFRDWATEKLFVAQMGAEEDRDAFAENTVCIFDLYWRRRGTLTRPKIHRLYVV
jgi:prophage antirepressor-like protein